MKIGSETESFKRGRKARIDLWKNLLILGFPNCMLRDMDYKNDFFNEFSLNNSIYEEDFVLGDILHQPSFSSMSDNINTITATVASGAATTTTTVNSLSFYDSASAGQSKHNSPSSIISGLSSFCDKPAITSSSHQSAYVLSFNNSTLIPATTDDAAGYDQKHEPASNRRASLKRTPENNHSESKAHQKTRKSRGSAETLDHIMSERKRRQELAEKFIALSATIPGLKKIDKSSVLSEAINQMKKLKERVKELEEQNKKICDGESLLMPSIKKSSCHHFKAEDDQYQEPDDCFRIINKTLPEVEARVFHKQVLIRIHCEKHRSVMLNILAQLKSLHFSIISTSVLTFANSALDITIIAEVEEHKITVKEVVKKLRLAVLKTYHNQK